MNLSETARMLAETRAFWPHMTLAEGSADAWQAVLADVSVEDARRALLELSRRAAPVPGPGDIRREVARQLGLTAPAEHLAWQHATAVACDQGRGLGVLHPCIAAAYDVMGGAGGPLTHGDTTVRAQFRDTYRQLVVEHERQIASTPLHVMLEGQRRKMLSAAPRRDELEEPADPRAADRIRELPRAGRVSMLSEAIGELRKAGLKPPPGLLPRAEREREGGVA